jgi:rhamnosyl/mannosyltransferase
MRVLHFFRTYFPESYGGIEQAICQLCTASQANGIDSQVLTLSPNIIPPELIINNHKVFRCQLDIEIASTGFSLSVLQKFRELAADADIIHYHFPWPFMDVLHFAAHVNKPTVLTYHSDIVRQWFLLQFYRPLMLHFLSSVDRIVASSPNYLETSSVLGHFSNKVRVIPYGLDKASYPIPSDERCANWRRRIGEKFFLFVGILRYYKGLHILLDAARGTGYPIVIVGAGPTENELKEHAERNKMDNVIFLGALPDEDKVALLRLCYAIVFPSHLRSEAFGISLLEGAMYGKPMISSEIGTGTSYVNIHGETGLVVPPSDSMAFRQAMNYLWENPQVAQGMGEKAEARYWNLFTADRMAASHASLYKELLEKH